MTSLLDICVLAAGDGSRMGSDKPKVLLGLAGRPLLFHLLDTLADLHPSRLHLVVGRGADQVKAVCADHADINWVHQAERLGTGHAVQQVVPHLAAEGRTLILLGDAPLIRRDTLKGLLASDAELTLLTVDMPDPFNYGRILRRGDEVIGVIEEQDASEDEKAITEINTGVMLVENSQLIRWLGQLDRHNAQQEFLLTDIVAHANSDGVRVAAIKSPDPLEVTGINTFSQLVKLERDLQMKTAEELVASGVQLMDAARLDVRGDLEVGQSVFIDINVVFEGKVRLGDGVHIEPNCVIRDSEIGSGSRIRANSVLEEARLGKDCIVGPFARLRPGANLLDEVRVGNFVEVKKTTMGRGSKANHLTYLGDAVIGEEVNIGAGTITCNYDGAGKHQTQIDDDAFIGSNASLVAPVSVGAGATVGAGSTITHDVAPKSLAVSRGKQKMVTNWQRPVKED